MSVLKKYRKSAMILGLLAAAAFLLFFPFPRKVDISGEFIGWQNNNADFSETRAVTLTGTYRKPLIGKPEFRGKLEIEGITEHWQTENIIVLTQSFGKYDGPIFLWFPESGNYVPSFGWYLIYASDFSSVSILMPAESADIEEKPEGPVLWSASNTKVLTYPASTREEAVTVTEKLTKGTSLATQWK